MSESSFPHTAAESTHGADDLHRTDRLLDGLNVYLITRDETHLADLLAGFPDAVRIGVHDFLTRRCPVPPPLGIRPSNEADAHGRVDWELELLTDEAIVAPGAEARTWTLPGSAPLLFTWISKYSKGNAVTNAVAVALEASADGRWVRLHTVEHDSASEIRVDVFDVPPPMVEQV